MPIPYHPRVPGGRSRSRSRSAFPPDTPRWLVVERWKGTFLGARLMKQILSLDVMTPRRTTPLRQTLLRFSRRVEGAATDNDDGEGDGDDVALGLERGSGPHPEVPLSPFQRIVSGTGNGRAERKEEEVVAGPGTSLLWGVTVPPGVDCAHLSRTTFLLPAGTAGTPFRPDTFPTIPTPIHPNESVHHHHHTHDRPDLSFATSPVLPALRQHNLVLRAALPPSLPPPAGVFLRTHVAWHEDHPSPAPASVTVRADIAVAATAVSARGRTTAPTAPTRWPDLRLTSTTASTTGGGATSIWICIALPKAVERIEAVKPGGAQAWRTAQGQWMVAWWWPGGEDASEPPYPNPNPHNSRASYQFPPRLALPAGMATHVVVRGSTRAMGRCPQLAAAGKGARAVAEMELWVPELEPPHQGKGDGEGEENVTSSWSEVEVEVEPEVPQRRIRVVECWAETTDC